MKDVKIPKALFFKTDIHNSYRNVGLDILRSITLFFVIFYHTNNYAGKFTEIYSVTSFVMYFAQEAFFSLSGFLIGNQILKYLNYKNSFVGVFNFYINRWVRTIPFYFIFLVINYILFYFIYSHSSLSFFKGTSFSLINYITLTQNLFTCHPYFFPEIWPLSFEEWSFILIPIPIYFLNLFAKRNASAKKLIALLFFCVILVTIFRVIYIVDCNPDLDWDLRKIVVYRLDALLYGFIVRILINQFSWFNHYKHWLLFFAILLSLIFFYSRDFLPIILYKTLFFSLIPAFISLTLPYFYFSNFNWLSLKFKSLFTHFSLISYSALLSHLYFIQFSMLMIYYPDNLFQATIFTLIYFIVVLIFSTLFFNYIERPILIKRKKLN